MDTYPFNPDLVRDALDAMSDIQRETVLHWLVGYAPEILARGIASQMSYEALVARVRAEQNR